MTRIARARLVPVVASLTLLLLARPAVWAQESAKTDGRVGTPGALATDPATLSLEQLVELPLDSVYAASAYAQKISEAPASVSIITQEDIARFGYRTLDDVLRSVRGFYVTNDRNYSYLGVRGFSRPGDYNARILLLIDGHRVNDNVFGSAQLGTEFPLDLDLVERVEVVRGPSSSLYGTNAFFGVINVITRGAGELTGLDVAGTFGSLNSRRGRVTWGHGFGNGTQVLLSGSMFASDGQRQLYFREFDTPETNRGIARDVDADGSTHMLARVRHGGLTLQALHGSREKIVPTASFGTVFNDPRSGTIETLQFIDATYERPFGTGWRTSTRVYYDRYAYDGTYVYAGEPADETIMNFDIARGSWWGAEAKLRRQLSARHTLALGTEYRDNLRQDQHNYDVDPHVAYLDDCRQSTNWAVYAQDEFRIHARLLLNLGLRFDQYDTFGGTTNPRAAVIYIPTPRTTIKLLHGSAFRAPNTYELFYEQPEQQKANPWLRPETNRASEVVVEQALGASLRAGATAFHYAVKDLITQETDSDDALLVYNNVDRIRARGLEFELDGSWASGISGRASYTLQSSRNEATGLRLTNSPTHVAQVLARAPIGRRGLYASFETRYLSDRRTIAGTTVPAHSVSNVTLWARHRATGLEITASIFNLFDRRFSDPGSEEHRQDRILQNGRSLRLNAVYRLPGFR